MIGVYSVLLGAGIIACALILLRREFKQAYFVGGRINKKMSLNSGDETTIAVEQAIVELESVLNEMSEAFYDISGNLEGKYSIHEKEIELLNEKITVLEGIIGKQGKIISLQEKQFKKIEKEKKLSLQDNVTVEKAFDLESRIDNINRVEDDKCNNEMKDQPRSVEVKPVISVSQYKKEENDIKAQIIALRSEGYSLKQIAKELNIGIGEIQLILNMKRS